MHAGDGPGLVAGRGDVHGVSPPRSTRKKAPERFGSEKTGLCTSRTDTVARSGALVPASRTCPRTPSPASQSENSVPLRCGRQNASICAWLVTAGVWATVHSMVVSSVPVFQ